MSTKEYDKYTRLGPNQLQLIHDIMHDPTWYMNGAEVDKGSKLYHEPWLLLNYCYFDLETADLIFDDEDAKTIRPDFRVIQFYGENHFNRVKFETFDQLIDPERPIPVELSERVHGIWDEDVVGCPTFIDVWPDIYEMLNEVDGLVTYNGDRFDIPGLVYECIRCGIPYDEFEPVLNKPNINPMVWEKEWRGVNHQNRLEDLAKRYGVKMMGRVAHDKEKLHDARVDVQTMAQLTEKMGEDLPFTLGKLIQIQSRFTGKQEYYFRKKREARAERKRKKAAEKAKKKEDS
jgi:DNA polymerase III epsilon subunit-like protein